MNHPARLDASSTFALLSAAAELDAGSVVVALAAAAGTVASPAPDWIKVAPRGRITTRTGKSYAFDPETLAARFNSDATHIPIDFEHGTVHLAAKGEKADAIGWIDRMEARQDGLYGHVDWLPAGKAALTARTHRYVSPTFPHDADGNAAWLHSVALVTAPALANMPALAHAADPKETGMLKTLALALGLKEDASETAILAAIADLKKAEGPSKDIALAVGLTAGADEKAILSAIGNMKKGDDKGETVAKSVYDQTLATLSATTDRVAALETGIRKEKVDGLLDRALKERRILPAQRDTYAALCATDDGLKQVTALIDASPAMLSASGLDERRPETGLGDPDFNPATLAAAANKHMAEQKAAGIEISYLDAFDHVEAEQKKKGK